VRAERERGRGSWAEGANERGEVGEQGMGLKRGAGARTWPENVQSWARPRRGDRGREVRDVLTSGDGGSERERARGEKNGVDSSGSRGRERERGRERALRFAPTGGARLSDTGGTRAWAGLNGPTWAELAFSIFLKFLLPFLFIFSRVFNSSFKFKPHQICATIQRIFRLNMMQHSMTHMFWVK
jgi:hypothetical protein